MKSCFGWTLNEAFCNCSSCFVLLYSSKGGVLFVLLAAIKESITFSNYNECLKGESGGTSFLSRRNTD